MTGPVENSTMDELKRLHFAVALASALALTITWFVGLGIGALLFYPAYRRLDRRLTRQELGWLAIIALISGLSAVATVHLFTHWDEFRLGLSEGLRSTRGTSGN